MAYRCLFQPARVQVRLDWSLKVFLKNTFNLVIIIIIIIIIKMLQNRGKNYFRLYTIPVFLAAIRDFIQLFFCIELTKSFKYLILYISSVSHQQLFYTDPDPAKIKNACPDLEPVLHLNK